MEQENSLLRKMVKAEAEEIQKLKWIESEKSGFDIGKDRAVMKWVMNYKSLWSKWWLNEERLKSLNLSGCKPSQN